MPEMDRPLVTPLPVASVSGTPLGVGDPPRLQLPLEAVTDIALRRRNDLVDLRVRCYNLGRAEAVGAPLQRLDSAQDAYLSFELPAQHIVEDACVTDPPIATDFTKGGFPACAASGPTLLLFRIPAAMKAISFTADALLKWSEFEAIFPFDPPDPAASQVAAEAAPRIEVPTGLSLVLTAPASWRKDPDGGVIGPSGASELWHAKLLLGAKPLFRARSVAAWSVSSQVQVPEDGERRAIAWLSDGDKVLHKSPAAPAPFAVRQLMVSGLGAWLDARGAWSTDNDFSDPALSSLSPVIEWQQRAALGRDQFVRVVEKGFMFPLGHRATKTKVWQRAVLDGEPVAGLLSSTTFQIKQAACFYGGNGPFASGSFPFSRVRAAVNETPKVLAVDAGGALNPAQFLQIAVGVNYLMPFAGTDADGEEHHFSTAVLFVPDNASVDPAILCAAYGAWTQQHWSGASQDGRVPLNGRLLAYVARLGGNRGDTAVVTDALRFSAKPAPMPLPKPKPDEPEQVTAPFLPILGTAAVRLSALAHLGSDGAVPSVDAAYPGGSVGGPVSPNTRFLDFLGAPLPIVLDQKASGAIAAPHLQVGGIGAACGLTAA